MDENRYDAISRDDGWFEIRDAEDDESGRWIAIEDPIELST
ncbi:hypothetical protein [Halarchaeum sp. P4]